MSAEKNTINTSKALHPGVKPKLIDVQEVSTPLWIEIINDLVVGAGYNYSRIAYRINVSPSTIQKLATNINRSPRDHIYQNLLNLYQRVFQGPFSKPQTQQYFLQKEANQPERMLLIKRALQYGVI